MLLSRPLCAMTLTFGEAVATPGVSKVDTPRTWIANLNADEFEHIQVVSGALSMWHDVFRCYADVAVPWKLR